MREATPAAANVARGANGVSESLMACDTGLVDPAPLRHPKCKTSPHIKHSRDLPQTLASAVVLFHLEAVSSTTQPIHGHFFVDPSKLYHVVVVEDGGASKFLTSSKGDTSLRYITVTKLRIRVSKHRL